MKLQKYEFSGFSPEYGCMMQGALSAVVYGPHGQSAIAHDLAVLMADGFTREVAGKIIENHHGCSAKGFLVKNAKKVQ